MPIKTIAATAIASAAIAAAAGILLYRDRTTYKRFRTRFGRAKVYQVLDDAGEPLRLLEVDGTVQSGTYLDERYTQPAFPYMQVVAGLLDSQPALNRVLVMGCGGYDLVKHIVAQHPHTTVDAVEIDPAVTAIARTYFFLDRLIEEFDTESNGRLNLICDDAFAYLQHCPHTYDAIICDLYAGNTPSDSLDSSTAARLARKHLAPSGIYCENMVSAIEGPEAERLDARTAVLAESFAHVEIAPCPDSNPRETDNVILVAQAE